VRIGGLTLTPVPVKHGVLDILGWKIREGDRTAVYLTDTSFIPPPSLELIREPEYRRPEVLIVGGLRKRPHETHFNFEQALSAGAEIRARGVYITHICHSHSHREIGEYCADWKRRFKDERGLEDTVMEPAYDQLELGR
jgi:phosphoribosyl 1,2-cyclic phosphate phosphodiesterase